MPILLGIDAGTTNMKAVLSDERGNILDCASSPAKVLTPFEGACEMDMNGLWELLCKLTNELKAKNPEAFRQICGMGISAQGDGMWAVGKDGEPVGHAILWNDVRTRELDGIGEQELDALLIKRSSTALFAGASPLILKWIKEKEPERFAKIHRAVRCKDWLNLKLTGKLVSDHTDYSTCGINIFTKEHVPEIYDFLEVPEAKNMLPTLVAPTDIVGAVTAEAEAQTGIAAGVPVIAGAIDVVATAHGAGVAKTGDGCVILGTTLCNEILLDAADVDTTDRNGSALCAIVPGKFIRVMAALSGNSTIDWAKSVLAPDLKFIELENELENVSAGSRGIIYHPYICGERAPFRDPFACGGFYGLTASHTRFDMMRAVYEGMALSLADCHKALPEMSGEVYLSGGGAVSDFTCALLAHVLGKRVVRQNRKELAARGIIEAVKLGIKLDTGVDADASADIFEPDMKLNAKYGELYNRFKLIREQVAPYWKIRGINTL